MAKMRVHELAKELGIDNKELLALLEKKNVEVKSHMSSLEETVVEEIKQEMGKKKQDKPEAQKDKPTESSDKPAGEPAAPKKKNLAFVIRPQNAKNVSRLQGKRPARPQRPANRIKQTENTQDNSFLLYTSRCV